MTAVPTLTSIGATMNPAFDETQFGALHVTDAQGKTYVNVKTILVDEAADYIDIESISHLTSQIQTDLRALEAVATQLFTIESGQVPGLKREVFVASAPSDRALFMQKLGFNLPSWLFCLSKKDRVIFPNIGS